MFLFEETVTAPSAPSPMSIARVTCPEVEVTTFDDEENLVASDQLVCPLPPTQSVCVQGDEAA